MFMTNVQLQQRQRRLVGDPISYVNMMTSAQLPSNHNRDQTNNHVGVPAGSIKHQQLPPSMDSRPMPQSMDSRPLPPMDSRPLPNRWIPDLCPNRWIPDLCHNRWIPDLCHNRWIPDLCRCLLRPHTARYLYNPRRRISFRIFEPEVNRLPLLLGRNSALLSPASNRCSSEIRLLRKLRISTDGKK